MSDQPPEYSHPNAVHQFPPHPAQGYSSVKPQTSPPYQPGYTQPPPPYNQPHPGHAQPSPQYTQLHPGYAPPSHAYPSQSVGYAQPVSQPHTNVVVVGGVQPTQPVVERPRVNHILHLIITIFFWPWVIVWLILCMQEGLIS